MVRVRKIYLDDLEKLQNISSKTFMETFESLNTKENMDNYVRKSFNLQQLESELNNYYSEFYFAELDTQVVGYLKINFGIAQTEIKENKGMEIERIYVLNSYQKKRVGQLLFEKAISSAKEKGCNYVWLGVWEKNTKAQHFYKKNGFVEFDQHIFVLGNDKQTDLMMKLEI
ncbi:MAG: GNAT family N-acetyltransferase [Apibacter sp.]|nr:GNAT family N-acetyltransferase [Apibacter sp.]